MIIEAKTLFDGTRFLKDVSVEVEGSRITYVGKPRGKPDLKVAFITPAFIDAHSHIGLDRHADESADVNDEEDSVITFADALDGIQMDDANFRSSVEAGILYSCIMPGSGNIISGRAVVVRNFAKNTKEAYVAPAGYKVALGYNPSSTDDWKGSRPTTRIGVVAHLRRRLIKASNELSLVEKGKKDIEELDVEDLFFARLLRKEEHLRVHLHKEDDLYALLRLGDAFGLSYTVDHTMAITRPEPYEELRDRGVKVVYGPLDSFAYKFELLNESWRNISALLKSKVEFGLMSDHPVILQSTLPLTLRWFLRLGLSKEFTLSVITKNNARVLGLSQLGEIKKGKLASMLAWDGDPFHLENKLTHILAEGVMEEVVPE